MQRLIALLAVAALAAVAWWIAASVSSGPDQDTPSAETGGDEPGLTVHVYVADRDGTPVTPAQVAQVYREARTPVDASGYARLEGVLLRADEAPSAEAFAVALKPLARHHALRRGFAPTATKRADGSWEVRYALHAYGILRVHVEAVDLGTCKAFLERDEPLRRWEPVGGHAVVRPGSVVDFRIYEGWDAAGFDGKVPVRLEGEADSDGIVAVATQRVLVDAPSPGHTAQLTLVPEPVDPILGVVRVKEGPPPPTLRGTVLVHQVEDDGSKTYVGTVPIDDEGSFTIRDAGARAYEIVAGLDFAPGLITTKTKGGDYLELVTPGRARWVELTGAGPGVHRPMVAPAPRGATPAPETLEPTVRDLRLRAWFAAHAHAWMEEDTAFPLSWRHPASQAKDGKVLVALPGAGSYQVILTREATETQGAGIAILDPVVLEDGASRTEAAVAWTELPHGTLVVDVDPAGWRDARSVVLEVAGRKRTIVRGGTMKATFAHVPTIDGKAWVTATWDDPSLTEVTTKVTIAQRGSVRVRAQHGGTLAVRVTGPGAATLTAQLDIELVSTEGEARRETLSLVRRSAQPVWEAAHAVPPGTYTWNVGLATVFEGDGIAPWSSRLTMLPEGTATGTPRQAVVRAGETTTLSFELPAK